MSEFAAGKLSIRCREKGVVDLVAFKAYCPRSRLEIVDVDSELSLILNVSGWARALARGYQSIYWIPLLLGYQRSPSRENRLDSRSRGLAPCLEGPS